MAKRAISSLAALAAVVALLISAGLGCKENHEAGAESGAGTSAVQDTQGQQTTAADLDNQAFRDRVVAFVRQVSLAARASGSAGAAAGAARVRCELALASKRPFRTAVWIYHLGAPLGRGEATDARLCVALKEATLRAMAATGDKRGALADARFAIDLPDHDYALVEYQGKGVELSHGLVPVRVLDKALVRRRIDEGKTYLLRVIDPRRGGVHKYYYAATDRFESRLHTIYTASTVLTLLKLYAYDGDERLIEHIRRASDFLLSMQSRGRDPASRGAFFYSFDLETEQPEPKLVVGTTSKTIFTLLALHAFTKDAKYMDAAVLAADWLISMQQPDGSVRSSLRRKQSGAWVSSKKESMLYTGQVLSALSRMYGATKEPRYLHAATQTASYLATKVGRQGCYLGDDYRKPNPISSSWVILSLFDFVKTSGDARFERVPFRCADELLGRQIDNAADVYRYGRWRRSLSSSGNGWLAEVLSELYLDCKVNKADGCERYQSAIVKVLRLLMQYTYSPENAFVARDPGKAVGGLFWNVAERYVRTDSVCHAMNAYINMIGHLGEGPLVQVPEPPLAQRLEPTGSAARPAPGNATTP